MCDQLASPPGASSVIISRRCTTSRRSVCGLIISPGRIRQKGLGLRRAGRDLFRRLQVVSSSLACSWTWMLGVFFLIFKIFLMYKSFIIRWQKTLWEHRLGCRWCNRLALEKTRMMDVSSSAPLPETWGSLLELGVTSFSLSQQQHPRRASLRWPSLCLSVCWSVSGLSWSAPVLPSSPRGRAGALGSVEHPLI